MGRPTKQELESEVEDLRSRLEDGRIRNERARVRSRNRRTLSNAHVAERLVKTLHQRHRYAEQTVLIIALGWIAKQRSQR